MNLLLEDWGKAVWMKEVVKKLRTRFRQVHKETAHATYHFPQVWGEIELVDVRETRFGSNFIMVDRLLQVRTALEQSVVDPQWASYMSKLRDSRTVRAHTISKKIKDFVLNEHFWERCTNFREVVALVMWALRDFNGKGPCMEKILHIFHNLEYHVSSLRGDRLG
jgi:hypothetical protein